MPFPIYAHETLSTFTGGDESPIREGGLWADYTGWPAFGRRVSNEFGQQAVADTFFASIWVPRTFSDAEFIFTVTSWNGAADTFDVSTRINGNAGAAPTLTNRNDYVFYWTTDGTISIVRHDNNVETSLSTNGGNSFTAPFQLGIQTIGRDLSLWHAATPGGAFTQEVSYTVPIANTFYSAGHFALGGFGDTVRFNDLTAGVPSVPLDRSRFPKPRLRYP